MFPNIETESQNAFVNPQHFGQGKERRRLYSWSRPSRRSNKSKTGSESLIQGRATLAFAKDGSWFQGNIMSPTEDYYTVTGRRLQSRLSSVCEDDPPHPGLHPDLLQTGVESSNYKEAVSSLSSSYSSNSPRLHFSQSPSEADSLDSEVVAQALEALEWEEDCVEAGIEAGGATWDITILDLDTGVRHKVQGAGAHISGNECKLSGENIRFESDTYSKGVKADKLIHSHMGPGLVDRQLVVYQGEFSYTYSDLLRCSSSPPSSQYCL